MKQKLTKLVAAIILIMTLLATTTPVLASGDQERGDNAQGSANQVQIMDPPPFQP